MALDSQLIFHGSASGGTSISGTILINMPSVDLGSNSVNRTLLLERRVTAITGASGFAHFLEDSTDNVTFSTMPGAVVIAGTYSQPSGRVGFKQAVSAIYSSTDAVAADPPDRIVFRADKRYLRVVHAPGTTVTSISFSIVGKVLGGAFSGTVGPRDV